MASPASYALSRHQPQKLRRLQDDKWIRSDGRGFHQCRPAFLRTGATTAASGSAYAEFGSTKVIVSVFGPRESKKAMKYSGIGRLNCNVSFATFSTPSRSQESDHKDFSSMLHKALEGAVVLESFPKTTVDVFALVLESGGSDLPAVISCASLALADAGIMMYDLVASASVVRSLSLSLFFLSLSPTTILHEVVHRERPHHRPRLRGRRLPGRQPHGRLHAFPQRDHPVDPHRRVVNGPHPRGDGPLHGRLLEARGHHAGLSEAGRLLFLLSLRKSRRPFDRSSRVDYLLGRGFPVDRRLRF